MDPNPKKLRRRLRRALVLLKEASVILRDGEGSEEAIRVEILVNHAREHVKEAAHSLKPAKETTAQT
jgi:transposase